MKSYNEFKPKLVESNHVGTIPKFKKNILAFSMIGLLAVGTIAGSLFYTSYKTNKIEKEYQFIAEAAQSNNEVISQNLLEIERLISSYPEDDRKAFLDYLFVNKINPVEIVTPESVYALNEVVRQNFDEAIELIKNSPFRHVKINEQDPTSIKLNGRQYEPRELRQFQSAQKMPAPIRFKSDVLLNYKNLADESLNDSFSRLESSEMALNEVKKASNYLAQYNDFIFNIEKTMKLDGYKEEEIVSIIDTFKSGVTARAFVPNLEANQNYNPMGLKYEAQDLMAENFNLAKGNHEKVIAYLDEKRPEPKPEVKPNTTTKEKQIELPKVQPKVEEIKPTATPKPTQQQAPRRQQNSVPSW